MKKKIYYKVVYIRKGSFYSAAVTGEFRLEYVIGQITEPKIGAIFIFDSLQSATDFMGTCPEIFAILSGYATNIGKPKYVCLRYFADDQIMKFWERKNRRYEISKECPTGTLSCSSFIPTEIVYKGKRQ